VEMYYDRWQMNSKDLEGSGSGPIWVLTRHFRRRTEENHENLSQDSRRSSLDSNRTPPEYESRALLTFSVYLVLNVCIVVVFFITAAK
jgi:hypothetical protein